MKNKDRYLDAGTKISCEDYAETLENCWFYANPIDEMRDLREFSADRLFQITAQQADIDGVVLLDHDTWDYETFFWNMYNS